MLKKGDQAPWVDLPGRQSQTVRLQDYLGKYVVLYFYPKDDTPGCTQEGKDFRDLHNEFVNQNAVILGVSRDSVACHGRFCEKYDFPFELLSDHDTKLCHAYGVYKEKTLFGKMGLGIVRSTFLIDPQGKIAEVWRSVKVPGHAQKVLDALRADASS